MKKLGTIMMGLLMVGTVQAQQPAATTELPPENYTLNQRFGIIKAKAQSYKDYKVIKESVLDGLWKITRDSLVSKDGTIGTQKKEIAGLNSKVSEVQVALKQKEASMAETQYASTHIAVLGIDVDKSVFLSLVAVVVLALGFVIVTFAGRMKLLTKSLQEKKLIVTTLTSEYEDYKRRAMDKQTKLSRELQDERNKQHASRNS